MFDLDVIIEQVLLESLVRDKLTEISENLTTLKNNYDRSKKINSDDKTKLKSILSNFILKRIDMRYDLADLVKNKPLLKGGKRIVSEKDLDEYIFNMNQQFPNLILIHSSLFPNPEQQFRGPL